MSVRISTKQLLNAFGSTYRSIDVRSASLKVGDQWLNAMTVVRISRKSPEEIAARHRDLEQLHGKVNLPSFRIVLSALPFSEWDGFAQSCSEGVLRDGKREVRIEQTVAVETQLSNIQRHRGEVRNNDHLSWPSFEIWFGQHRPEKLVAPELGRELGSRGWSNAYEAINTVCEINLTQGGSFGHNFCVSIPVYSLISDLKFRPSDSRLQFEFFRAAELENISLLAVWKQTSRHQTPLIRARISPQVEPSETQEGIKHEKGSVQLTAPNEDDEIEIKAIYDEIGEIESWTARIRNIIPEPARNALFAAIRKFCPESEMQALLVRPYAQKGRKLKESAAYELHVSWLLSMYGFSPFILGEYEQIVDEGTKVRRASVDIIAGTPGGKTLLIAACTISTPKEEDFMNLVHAAEILRREVFADTSITVYPVLFTGALGMDSRKENADGYSCVPIIDADAMSILMQHLKAGAEQLFLQFLGNPRLCQLRSLDEEY